MNENTVSQVIDKSFQITADTVYGALVVFLFVVILVLIIFLSRERKDRKDATKQLLDITQSYATTFSQVNETMKTFGNDVRSGVDKIVNHLNIR